MLEWKKKGCRRWNTLNSGNHNHLNRIALLSVDNLFQYCQKHKYECNYFQPKKKISNLTTCNYSQVSVFLSATSLSNLII